MNYNVTIKLLHGKVSMRISDGDVYNDTVSDFMIEHFL
jgi:hypothetical protein